MAAGKQFILVPLDGSKNAENALPGAAMLSRVYDLPIEVVHVLDAQHEKSTIEDASRAFRDYGDRLVGSYGLPRDRSRFQVFQGPPAETILAMSENAGWIAIASHGRGGFRAMFIGSVADKVVRASTVPVLLVPGVGRPPEPPTKILVALDGSAEAERSLEKARELAKALNAKVVLLRAYTIIPPAAAGWAAGYPPEVLEMVAEDATTYLRKIAAPNEEAVTVRGDAAQAIVAFSNEIDAGLVVMTASGKGLAGRLALGSTTDRVIHSLHRPLIVIPPAE
jgi:nucleotide-binding universal stress UspA family protein